MIVLRLSNAVVTVHGGLLFDEQSARSVRSMIADDSTSDEARPPLAAEPASAVTGYVPPGVSPTAAAGKILDDIAEDEDRLPGRPLQWLGMMLAAAVVGATTGVVGAIFRITLAWLERERTHVVALAHAHAPAGIGWMIPLALCAVGAAVGSWLTEKLAPHTAGSGIPRVEAVLRSHLRPAGALILPVKFIGGALSIGSGLALGREGPTVQMGGTVGRLFYDAFKKFTPEPWTMIAAGAGAGLAVAFNAPLAATLFVVEELIHRFSARIFSATLIACISGTLVLRAMLGNATDFHVLVAGGTVPATVLPEYLLLGVVAGLLGVGFNVCLLASLRGFGRFNRWPSGSKGAIVGAAAGLIAWFAPAAVGGGETLAQAAIDRPLALSVVAGLLGLRFMLTMASYGCGAPGGIFAPLLALGALLGSAFYSAVGVMRHAPPHPSAYVVVAMAACFTAVVRSPLSAVVLVLEMTGAWTLILPMMAASVTAYAIPELLRNEPIYDSLRARDEAMERAQGKTA
jgi:CIC family chloride channel protein